MDARTLHFKLVADNVGFAVELSVDGALPIRANFPFDLREDTRTFEVLRRIETGSCDNDDLRDVGSQLWASLLSKDVGRRVEEIRAAARSSRTRLCFELEVPPQLARLPWETLYDMRDAGFVATAPDYTLVRRPPGEIAAPQPPLQADHLRVLVVIPEGSFLNADMEWKNIERALQPLGSAASLKRLGGRVSPIRLATELAQHACDVLHFIGHGEVDSSGAVTVRLNDEVDHSGEIWLDAEDFGGLFRRTAVRLSVLNCCLGAYPSETRTLSGLGPYLLRAGVPAVVAMRYEIPDEVAVLFSSSFYKELVCGDEPGRADLAVQSARKHVSLNKKKDTVRGFVTPVLFCANGRERLFELKATISGPKAPAAVRRGPKVALPPRLIDATRQGRIVPVIGPGILSGGDVRSASAAGVPTLGALARRLAQESSYPEIGELALGETAGEWLEALLLQRICQHYEQENERYQLTSTVLEAHPPCPPPAELDSIARWSVPGIVYTHFDGLMELAFRMAGRAVRVANTVDQGLSLLDANAPLLLHLRGSVTAKDSLVLTEQDHDALWDSFNRIDAQVVSLVNGGLGRSLLFLGVSPRDIFVKRFISQLLTPTIMKNLGPMFFVRPLRSKVDEACWRRFKVQWLDVGVDVLIEELTAVAREGTGR